MNKSFHGLIGCSVSFLDSILYGKSLYLLDSLAVSVLSEEFRFLFAVAVIVSEKRSEIVLLQEYLLDLISYLELLINADDN